MSPQSSTSRNWKVWLPFILSIVLVLGILVGMRLPSNQAAIRVIHQDEMAPSGLGNGKVEELIRYIEAKYVDDVNRDKLVDDAIASIMDDLDPHSSYYSARDAVGVKESLEGKFDGIGIEFMIIDDTIMVTDALEEGPSFLAGIRRGDKMISIGDSLVAGVGITNEKIFDQLRGEKGSVVEIAMLDGTTKELVPYSLERDRIPSNSIDVAYMLNEKTGLLK